jgi:recombination protein RecT
MNAPRQPSTKLARPDQPELTNAVAQRDQNAPVSFAQARDKFVGQLDMGVVQAIGKGMDPVQFKRSLATVLNETPDLLKANLTSLAVAVLHAARLGLDLTPALQLAYLTPFNVSQKVNGQWVKTPLVKMMIGYKGFILLGRKSGMCDTVRARVVYANDHFEWEEGTAPRLVHKPTMGERGDVVAAYCVADMKTNGKPAFRVIGVPEIERARAASRGAFEMVYENGRKPRVDTTRPKADSPWTTDYGAMAAKTAIRRFYKDMDLTEFRSLATAIEVDDAYAIGSRIPAPTAISGDPVKPPEQLSPTDEWGDDVLFGNRDEDDEQHETIVDASASERE